MRTTVALAALILLVTPPPLRATQALDVAGAWKLNRDLTQAPERDMTGGEPGRRPGGGGMGGRGGRGGGGFGRGGGGGMPGGMGQRSDGDLRKMAVVRSRLIDIADRLIIVHDGAAVSITDGTGRRLALKADGKKQQQVTGDGEFKTRTHFEGWKLIVEEDFGGPRVITTYTPTLEGGEIRRLEVVVRAEGGRSGPNRPPLTRVYDNESR